MNRSTLIILAIVCILLFIAPLVIFNGHGEDDGFFGGADDAAGDAINESVAQQQAKEQNTSINNTTGYEPWFNSIWEPPSGEIESLLFALQAAIGAIIIGYFLGYWRGQKGKED